MSPLGTTLEIPGGAAAEAGNARSVLLGRVRSVPSGADPAGKSGWIDVSICEAILTKDIKVLISIDGSEHSMTALHFGTDRLLQCDKTAFAEVFHIYDTDENEKLPPACRKDALRSKTEAILTSSVSSKRYKVSFHPIGYEGVGDEMKKRGFGEVLTDAVCELPADFILMGCYNFTGPTRQNRFGGFKLSSKVFDVLSGKHNASIICFKDDNPQQLPLGPKKAVFVVSVSLNKSSTKAFLDALRLSKPGDEIHVVYIKSYLEREESDYTTEVRAKYEAFFSGLQDGNQAVFHKFHDRETKFVLEPKLRRETTPQAVVRYADSVEADFIVVGANAADRVERGKAPIGSVSFQVCMLTSRNFIVANWIDVIPRVFEESVRRARTPSQGGSRPGTASQTRSGSKELGK